jgi:methyl-accepting chemotaxis protein
MSESNGFRIGIFPKILVVMLLVSIIPLAVNWYTSNQNNTDRISATVYQRLQDTSIALGTFVDGWIEMNVRMLRQNSSLPAMKAMQGDTQKPILESIVKHYDWNYLAFTVDADGQNISRSDDNTLKDYSDRIYVKQVIAGRDLGQQVLIGKTSGKPALVLATPLKNKGERAFGALAIAMTLAEISEKIASSSIDNTGFAFLMDEFGKVIAHPNQEYTNQREDFSSHPAYLKLRPGESTRVTFIEDGKTVVGVVTPIKQGWSLVVQQDYDEAFVEIEKSNRQAMLLFVATLVLSLLVAIIVSRRLASPIRRLTFVADDISRGSFKTEIEDVHRNDELGDLARAVERLGISVKLATERLSRQSR